MRGPGWWLSRAPAHRAFLQLVVRLALLAVDGRLIVGAGGKYAKDSKGGNETHGHSMTGSVGSATLSTYEMPSHKHGMTTCMPQNQVNGDYPVDSAGNYLADRGATTHYAGSSGSHSHSLSASAAAASGLPPYYALSYIMKL